MTINKYYQAIMKLVAGKTNNTFLQLFRYTFVGGLAFLIDFSTLFTLTEYFKINYLVSAAIAFVFGLLINYMLSVIWVFSSTMKNRWLEFLLFAIIGLVGLVLNEFFIYILTDVLLIYYLFSKIITTCIVYFWNFFARKTIIFNNK